MENAFRDLRVPLLARRQFGTLLNQRIFSSGKSAPWPKFVKDVTGQELTPKYFSREVR